MLDIDHFKHFHDTFGHDAGDILLSEIGQFLQKYTRKQDVACRYGGEEFTLILPDAPLDATTQRAEDLRLAVKHVLVKHQDRLLGPISLSLGVAAFPYDGLTPTELLKAADEALFSAKAEGRDRVVARGSMRTSDQTT